MACCKERHELVAPINIVSDSITESIMEVLTNHRYFAPFLKSEEAEYKKVCKDICKVVQHVLEDNTETTKSM